MTRLRGALAGILAAALVAGSVAPASADDSAIVPLSEYVERHGLTDRWSRRFVLDRCTALYIFASATAKGHGDNLRVSYEDRATLFLEAARDATEEKQVLLMLVTRMANAYKRYADATPQRHDPLAHPFFQAELAFCADHDARDGARQESRAGR